VPLPLDNEEGKERQKERLLLSLLPSFIWQRADTDDEEKLSAPPLTAGVVKVLTISGLIGVLAAVCLGPSTLRLLCVVERGKR